MPNSASYAPKPLQSYNKIGKMMSFIRENISEADIVAYGLREINEDLFVVGFGNGWVIDRERNIYLRWIRLDKESPSTMTFTFFWKGVLLEIDLISRSPNDATFEENTTWTLAHPPLDLPPALEMHRQEILADFRSALSAYGSFGMSSRNTYHHATIAF
jgi:hypothetical protein